MKPALHKWRHTEKSLESAGRPRGHDLGTRHGSLLGTLAQNPQVLWSVNIPFRSITLWPENIVSWTGSPARTVMPVLRLRDWSFPDGGRSQPSSQHHELQGAGPVLKLCSSFLRTSLPPPLILRPSPTASPPRWLAEHTQHQPFPKHSLQKYDHHYLGDTPQENCSITKNPGL